MKCDELKAFRALNIDEDETGMAYPKAAVDAAIDELKSENAELKAKLESVQASAYADSVDAGMENRKLKAAAQSGKAYDQETIEISTNKVSNYHLGSPDEDHRRAKFEALEKPNLMDAVNGNATVNVHDFERSHDGICNIHEETFLTTEKDE